MSDDVYLWGHIDVDVVVYAMVFRFGGVTESLQPQLADSSVQRASRVAQTQQFFKSDGDQMC